MNGHDHFVASKIDALWKREQRERSSYRLPRMFSPTKGRENNPRPFQGNGTRKRKKESDNN